MKWFLVIVSFGVFPDRIYAYLDPGVGSYAVQILLGVVFGGVYILKSYWRSIKHWFALKNKRVDHSRDQDR